MSSTTPIVTPCESNPDLWFTTDEREIEQAKSICRSCPIAARNACLRQGFQADVESRRNGNKHGFGVFGGLDPAERNHLWKNRRTGKATRFVWTDDARNLLLQLTRDGWYQRDVAVTLGISENAVKMRLRQEREAGNLFASEV
jgi:hypothetical protein